MRNLFIASALAVVFTGCANYDQKQLRESLPADSATEQANVAAASVEIAKVNPGEINLYVYYHDATAMAEDQHKLSLIYQLDNSHSFELVHGQYRLHRLSANATRIGAMAFCGRGDFTKLPPVQGDYYRPENYRNNASINSVALPTNLEPGKSYVVEITPKCFLNRYSSSIVMSAATFIVSPERDVKRIVSMGTSRE